jgi:hypothetical protein
VLSDQRRETVAAAFPKQVPMSNINPNCDGSHCRHGYKEVRLHPLGGGDDLWLCLPCFIITITPTTKWARYDDHSWDFFYADGTQITHATNCRKY